ncbi:MAG TPA: peroxide stress protein YaaA [Actinomycetales bacterium]|nr:peroxide stress protein YaaA [Actinomycetales bacterium]
MHVLILLPPSEGKTHPTGPPLDFNHLSRPELHPVRRKILTELDAVLNSPTRLRQMNLQGAAEREFPRNADLVKAPAGPAGEVYSGVLFQALDLSGLSALGRRRASSRLAIASALWGLVSVADHIPAYRLSAGMKLGRLGDLNALWRSALASVLDPIAAQRLIIDCRSGPYVAAWRPRGAGYQNWLPVRVFQDRAGKRTTVSHDAKRTRGLLARHVLNSEAPDPRTPDQLAQIAQSIDGIEAEITNNPRATASQPPRTLDLIRRA